MRRIRIIAKQNGPYLIEINGNVVAALCRCGSSNKKPYCDGTHAKIGFRADEAVPIDLQE